MMMQTGSKKKEFKGLPHGWWILLMILLPFVFLGVFGLGFSVIIENLHYSVGILLAFIAVIVVVGIMTGVIQSNRIGKIENPVPKVQLVSSLSFSLTAIFILSATGAWISYLLSTLGVIELLKDSGEPTYGNLLQTYLWHLANIIPFTNVEKTFGMKDPIVQFTGWVAGLPILAFRFAVIVIILGVIKDAWGIFQKSSEEALLNRLKKRLDDRLVGKDVNLGKD